MAERRRNGASSHGGNSSRRKGSNGRNNKNVRISSRSSTKPGNTYTCKICGARGMHWYQQCPKAGKSAGRSSTQAFRGYPEWWNREKIALEKEKTLRGNSVSNLSAESTIILTGILRVNVKRQGEAFVRRTGVGCDVYIAGLLDRNRAMDDTVAVELLPFSNWRKRIKRVERV